MEYFRSGSSVAPNEDRAAVAEILTVINWHENSETALQEIQQIAVRALNEPTQPGDYWHRWIPDPEHANALPAPLRR